MDPARSVDEPGPASRETDHRRIQSAEYRWGWWTGASARLATDEPEKSTAAATVQIPAEIQSALYLPRAAPILRSVPSTYRRAHSRRRFLDRPSQPVPV